MEERGQFTLYRSHWAAIQRIKKPAERAAAYDAICAYALNGELPDLDKLPDAAAIVFDMAKPTLDNSRKKSAAGKKGGEKSTADTGAQKAGSNPSTADAVPLPLTGEVKDATEKKVERHKYGEYGWVRLSDAEYQRLVQDLGEEELAACIRHIDESAQQTSNKNKWKDWNLTIRKCSREGWHKPRTRNGWQPNPSDPQLPPESMEEKMARLKKLAGGMV